MIGPLHGYCAQSRVRVARECQLGKWLTANDRALSNVRLQTNDLDLSSHGAPDICTIAGRTSHQRWTEERAAARLTESRKCHLGRCRDRRA
jgi:hypothetical protein